MRKLLLICCLLGLGEVALAQWTPTGTNIYNSNAGNVGIGTTTPGAKLHIFASRADEIIEASGDHATLRLISASNTGGGAPAIYLYRGAGNAYGALFVERGFGGGNSPFFTGSYANDVVLGSVTSNPLKFGINNDVKMTIATDGGVGISTNSPNGYKLAVNGNMIAESVKVKLHSTWPDFVFHKDYSLKPLSEVEKYIQVNNHLPDIPSSREVAENGINLGEMDAKLLRKIEELTLHLIEISKNQKMLEQQVKEQHETIQKLSLIK